ncbi:MAG: efflux RND transporter permease subunit, partial [bacterium]
SALIPLVAVPVAIIGTFAAMAVMGFSLNTLSLFGLVLAIGIVVAVPALRFLGAGGGDESQTADLQLLLLSLRRTGSGRSHCCPVNALVTIDN